MKRRMVFCLTLVVALIMPISNAFADSFTLHNGVTFGMQENDVMNIEKENGLTFTETTEGNNFFPNNVLRIDSENTTVAGRDNSTITYMFDKNGLVNSMIYWASDFFSEPFRNNDAIISTLTEKYGSPVGGNGEFVQFPSSAYDAFAVCLNYKERHPDDNPNYDMFYQWLVPLDDGGYANIQFLMMGFPNVVNYRIITYSYITPEEVNALNEQNSSERQSINDDL